MLYFVPSVPHVLPTLHKIAAMGRYMREELFTDIVFAAHIIYKAEHK